jgi:hypothetical protein
MLKALALIFVLITAMEAQAASATLLCTGTSGYWSSARGPRWTESQRVVLPITIDIARNTLVLENKEYPIMAISDDTVFVDAYLYGIDTKIDLNQATGKVSMRFETRLDKGKFNGICRPS